MRHTIPLLSSYFGNISMAKVRISSNIIKPFSGKSDVVAWLKKWRLVVKLQQVDDMVSLLPLYLEGDTLALYMEIEDNQKQIETRLKEALTDDTFAAYRKGTIVWWTCGRLRQQNQAVGWMGRVQRRWPGEAHKTDFVMGFPDIISIRLQQVPNVEALTMGYLISRARVLTTTEKQNQDVVAATHSPHSNVQLQETLFFLLLTRHTIPTSSFTDKHHIHPCRFPSFSFSFSRVCIRYICSKLFKSLLVKTQQVEMKHAHHCCFLSQWHRQEVQRTPKGRLPFLGMIGFFLCSWLQCVHDTELLSKSSGISVPGQPHLYHSRQPKACHY